MNSNLEELEDLVQQDQLNEAILVLENFIADFSTAYKTLLNPDSNEKKRKKKVEEEKENLLDIISSIQNGLENLRTCESELEMYLNSNSFHVSSMNQDREFQEIFSRLGNSEEMSQDLLDNCLDQVSTHVFHYQALEEQRTRFLAMKEPVQARILQTIHSFIEDLIHLKGMLKYGQETVEEFREFGDELEEVKKIEISTEEMEGSEKDKRKLKRKLRDLNNNLEDAIEDGENTKEIEEQIAHLELQLSSSISSNREELSRIHQLISKHKPQLLEENEKVRNLLIPNQDFEKLPIGLFDGSGSLEDYEDVNQLETSSMHAIYKGRRKEDGQEIILKSYYLSSSSDRKHLSRQVSLIHKLEHPRLIKVERMFADDTRVFIEFPFYVNGSVEEYLSSHELSIKEKKSLLADLLLAVSHLHSNGVVHCDIKLGNIFVNENERGVLGDFDGSREVGSTQFSASIPSAHVTFKYLAPELLEETKNGEEITITPACDMYSIGVCVDEMFGEDGQEFFVKLKNKNPKERLTIQSAISHPFIAPLIDQLRNESVYDIRFAPLYWEMLRCDGSDFKIVELNQDSSVFQSIQDHMRKNWEGNKIGKGRDGNRMTHNSFDIKKIWRIENSLLWRRYASRRDCIALQPKDFSQDQIDKDLSCSYDRNEQMLFHGAPCGMGNTENIIDILIHQGFDERVSSKGLFGSGIYFSNSSSKSDCYAGRYQDSSIGETAKMILSRVCMGKFYETSSSMTSLRRPPCIEGHEGTCSHERCDSVLYDGTGRNYREFIVYDRNQCYPEFVIEYERKHQT